MTSLGRSLCVFLFCLAAVPVLRGQDYALSFFHPQADAGSLSSLSFERLLNTLSWNGIARLDRIEGPWSVHLDEHFTSQLIRGTQYARQENFEGTSDAEVRLSPEISGTLAISSLVVSGNRVADLGRLAAHRALAGIEYRPLERMQVGLSAGLESNAQQDQRDQGLAYAANIEGRGLPWEDVMVGMLGQWSESRLGRRDPATGLARLSFWRRFSPDAVDSLTAEIGTQRRAFYIAADPGVQSTFGLAENIFDRTATTWELHDRLRYRMGETATLLVDGGITNRTIERGNRFRVPGTAPQIADWRVREFQLLGAVQIDWLPADAVRLIAGISRSEREERHAIQNLWDLPAGVVTQNRQLAQRLENIAAQTTAAASVDCHITGSDRLTLRTSASILRYDTPDTLNTDDRDELRLSLRVDAEHRFSPALIAQLALELSGVHLVYLSAVESANNNWNRVIRFAPRIDALLGTRAHNVFSAEVIGNYTASDYEDQVAAVRSFAFRQAGWMDSLEVRLTDRLSATFAGGIRIIERGSLRWSEFQEHPEDAAIEKQLWPRVRNILGSWRIGVGYRFFAQDRYTYTNGMRVFLRSYQSAGPTASVEWSGPSAERVSIEGWRETQSVSGQAGVAISNVAMNVAFLL